MYGGRIKKCTRFPNAARKTGYTHCMRQTCITAGHGSNNEVAALVVVQGRLPHIKGSFGVKGMRFAGLRLAFLTVLLCHYSDIWLLMERFICWIGRIYIAYVNDGLFMLMCA